MRAGAFLLSRKVKARTRGLNFAEREGFEPSVQFPRQQLSRLLHSTALAPLHILSVNKDTLAFFALKWYCLLRSNSVRLR